MQCDFIHEQRSSNKWSHIKVSHFSLLFMSKQLKNNFYTIFSENILILHEHVFCGYWLELSQQVVTFSWRNRKNIHILVEKRTLSQATKDLRKITTNIQTFIPWESFIWPKHDIVRSQLTMPSCLMYMYVTHGLITYCTKLSLTCCFHL